MTADGFDEKKNDGVKGKIFNKSVITERFQCMTKSKFLLFLNLLSNSNGYLNICLKKIWNVLTTLFYG